MRSNRKATRRRVIGVGGSLAAIGLAGCLDALEGPPADDDPDDEPIEEPDDEPEDDQDDEPVDDDPDDEPDDDPDDEQPDDDEPDEPEDVLAVETREATEVTADSAMLHGELIDMGNVGDEDEVEPPEVVTVFFEYREVDEDAGTWDWEWSPTQDIEDLGEFEQEITELEADTEYEFRASAESEAEMAAGEELTFRTEAG